MRFPLLIRPDPVLLAHLAFGKDDFLQEHLRRHAESPCAEDDDLFDGIRCRHGDSVFFSEDMGSLFDIEVSCLRLLCIDDIDVVPAEDFALAACHLVGVKDEDDLLGSVTRKIGQDIHQLIPGGFDVAKGQLSQILPGKDDVVAVDQQIVVLGLDRLYLPLRSAVRPVVSARFSRPQGSLDPLFFFREESDPNPSGSKRPDSEPARDFTGP